MKTKLSVITLLCIFCYSCNASPQPAGPPDENTETFALIIGVLEWPDPNLGSFGKELRKDEELYNLLRSKEVKDEHIIFLKDEKATLNEIKSALNTVLNKTTEDSRFIFYYAGHGMLVNSTGKYYFANYDINTSKPEETGLDLDIIKLAIEKKFKGREVALWADCCYSGALEFTARALSGKGFKTYSLTSATAHNISTGNWTFSQTLIDCLSGNPVNDPNRDGKITLAEMATEVRSAMQYRERQLYGYSHYNMDMDQTVSTVSSSLGATAPEVGSYMFSLREKQWEMSRITGKIGDEFICEYYHYAEKETKNKPAHKIRTPYFVRYEVGEEIKIEYEGKWYEGVIEKTDGDFCFITYKGFDHSWDEWVLYDRIRTGKESAVEVLWEGQYFPAEILDEKDGQFYVHYTGDSYIWDEWVDQSRIK